jgi:hypothetical protein
MEGNLVVKNELQKVAVADWPIVIALPDKPENFTAADTSKDGSKDLRKVAVVDYLAEVKTYLI